MLLEPRPQVSRKAMVLGIACAIAASFLVAAFLVILGGASPFLVFWAVLTGAAGSSFAFLETLTRATPLIFTGLAAAVAFRAKLWNIGAEAQLYAGAIMAVVLGAGSLAATNFILVPIILLAGICAGAIMLLGPTLLKTRFGVDEVVTTLLLNFIMVLFVSMLLDGPLKDPMGLGWPQSEKVIADATLPKLVQGKRLHAGFLIAIAAALGVWFINARSTFGYEMRAVGSNHKAAQFAGIPVNEVMIKTALLSGGLAGMAGVSEVLGLRGNLTLDLSPGFGYTGIVVAMLAMLHPVGVIFASIFVAGVFVGADAMSRSLDVPNYIAHVMVATALLATIVAMLFARYRIRWT